jgi:hypothetical protein
MTIEEKIKELARKYKIPEKLFIEAMKLENGKDTLQNRRIAPKIVALIEKYTDSSR